MKQDVRSLLELMSSVEPPKRFVRGENMLVVKYDFGDASGVGFGSSWESAMGVKYRVGIWGSNNIDKSSNCREMRNLVDTVELMEKEKS